MEEIDGVRALLSSLPRPTSLAERRERLDTVASAYGTASDIGFEPVRIGTCEAEWSLAPDSDPDRVLLYFHGGGYCSGSIRSHRGMVSEIGRAAKVRTLALGYRLAPEHPFPAALEDAVAAVEYLLAMGIPAERIAIGGDSAGGGLTLATMIRLREAGRSLPACAWLVSPWVDLEMTGASIDTKDADDPLIHRAYLQELASAYCGKESPRNPLISPLYADLGGLPPILVQVGSAETLLDDAVTIVERLGEADRRVTLEIWPRMIHAWHLWSARLTAGQQAIASAGAYIDRHLAKWPAAAVAVLLFRHVSFDDRLALWRELVQMLAQAFDDAATAGLDAGAIFLEISLAGFAFRSRLRHRGADAQSQNHAEHRQKHPHDNRLASMSRRDGILKVWMT